MEAKIIGAKQFKNGKLSNYEKAVRSAVAPLKNKSITGFLPLSQVNKNWRSLNSPCPQSANQPQMAATLSTDCSYNHRMGGIPERAEGDIVSDKPIANFARHQVLVKPNKLKKYDIAWIDYPFDCASMTQKLMLRKNYF